MKIDSPTAIAAAQDDSADLDHLGDEIAELSAHLDAATARLLTLIREFDARAGWNEGFRSCAAWLSWRVGLDRGAARERVRVARALGRLPLLAEALGRGELSYSKVRALTRVATPETEARLLAVGRAGTAVHVERIVRGWRQVDRLAEARETAQRHASRVLHVYQDEDGMVIVRGRLEPEVGTLFMQALAAARETLYQQARREEAAVPGDPSADPPSMAQQQADALALIAETALHQGLDPGAAGERYQVVVHVDAAVLADPDQSGQSVLEDGARVPAETSRRLACDASRVVMRHDEDGRLLEVGARTRTIPPALRRALHHRDGGCRFPGCGTGFTQGHHLRHWAEGGPTTLSTSRCSVAGITARCTRRAMESSGGLTARFGSGGRMAGPCPRCHHRRRCPLIRSALSGRVTTCRAYDSTRGRRVPVGSGSASTWDGRSTSCTRWPRERAQKTMVDGSRFALAFPTSESVRTTTREDAMTIKRVLSTLTGLLFLGAATVASAQAPKPAGEMMGQHKMDGQVTKVDAKKGWVDVKTPEGSMKLHFPPSALANVKKGDSVTVELSLKDNGPAPSSSKQK